MEEKAWRKMIDKSKKKYAKAQLEYSRQMDLRDSLSVKSGGAVRLEKEENELERLACIFQDVCKEYSYTIFQCLSERKPDIIIRKTKEIVSWESVFPERFENLSEEQRKSLIALIEEDGGKYRLKRN